MALKIEILGPGCWKCKETEELVRKVVERMKLKAEITKVSDVDKFVDYGLMLTPGVAINEKLKIQGRVPSESDIEKAIKEES